MARTTAEEGADDAGNRRRGWFIAALVAAILVPLLAALLGLPPFDDSGRLSLLGQTQDTDEDAGSPADLDATTDAAADPDGADTSAGDTDDGTSDDGSSDGDTDEAPTDPEPETLARSSPWGPIEHILRISLCDGEACPRGDGDLGALEAALDDDPAVLGYVYLSPEETYDWLVGELEALADRISADRLAGMIHVTLAVGSDPQRARDRYTPLDGVSDVTWLTEGLSPQAQLVERERLGFDEDSRRVAVHLCEGVTCPQITDAERTALLDALSTDPDVVAVEEETAESAYERFERRYLDLPDVLAGLDPDTLPRPLRLTIGPDVDTMEVVARYRDLDGVDEVVWERHSAG